MTFRSIRGVFTLTSPAEVPQYDAGWGQKGVLPSPIQCRLILRLERTRNERETNSRRWTGHGRTGAQAF
jgi:hypothetical protein